MISIVINIMGYRTHTVVLLIALVIFSCNKKVDYEKIPSTTSNNNFNAVIEIPAGTNKKLEYSKVNQAFEIDKINGKERVIDFLPYIGNYGFIPSTYLDPEKGGDGDALDVLVLSESVNTGTVLEVKPIAMLKLKDDGEKDFKIIAVPSKEEHQVIRANSYKDLSMRYPEVKQIIELWFLSYNKNDKTVLEGWADESVAIDAININKLK